MAFTYDATLSGARDKLRFLLRDTVEASAAFEDAELDGMLTLSGDSIQAARLECLLVLLADSSRFLKWTQAQNSVDKTGALDALKALIKEVKEQLTAADTGSGEVVDFTKKELNYYGMQLDPDNSI